MRSALLCIVILLSPDVGCAATMASGDVDLCLVPESPIVLEGPNGCIPHLMKRVSTAITPAALAAGESTAVGREVVSQYQARCGK